MLKTIILAAGQGTRLRPLTLDRPKCLVEVDGKSLLDRQLAVLRHNGIDSIVLVTGFLSEKLARSGIRTCFNPAYPETNMVWSLFCAESEMSGEVIVSYGDIVFSPGVLQRLQDSPHDVSVVIDRGWQSYWQERFGNPLDDAETLKIDATGAIAEIGQVPAGLDDIQGQYIGLMKFSGKGLKALRKTFHEAKASGFLRNKPIRKAYMTDMLQAIIDTGHPVRPVFINGGWVEIDTIDDLNLSETRNRLRQIHTAVLQPGAHR